MRPLFYFYSVLVLIVSAGNISLDGGVNFTIYFSVLAYVILIYFLYKIDKYFSLTLLFVITFGVFIFGRHFSYILSGEEIDVYRVGFLSSDILNEQECSYWTFV